MPPAVASPAARAELAGRYRSEELDVEWTLTAGPDSALTLSRRRFPDQVARLAYRDAVAAGVGVLRFTRDARGRVTGFLLTAGRIRNVRFERME
jgi:hypothetical protein